MVKPKEGEFSLIYSARNGDRPVALTREQHDLLQALVDTLPGGRVVVLNTIGISYMREQKVSRNLK